MASSNGYGAVPSSYGAYNVSSSGYGNYPSNNGASGGLSLRRRRPNQPADGASASSSDVSKYRQRNVVKKLDFMFPKVDTEYTVQTDRGGIAFVVACIVIVVLCLAEFVAWRSQNSRTVEHVVVDTSLGQRMQVNLNITFPELACVDVHVDIMDVAGDSQLDLDGSFITKTRLFSNGTVAGDIERDEGNKHRKQQEIKEKPLPSDYCGPCFGAAERDDQCCNTCDELLAAYKVKQWRADDVLKTSEQCIREGRSAEASSDAKTKTLTLGEGCNLVGHMKLNRVAGNFHIAMGEGIQRNGKHVHIFNPEESHKFNASHIIHHLSFGGHHEEPFGAAAPEETPLNGIMKIVEEKHGTTGLFQYFIKIVPTTYVTPGPTEVRRETNGFFFTERFRPLMKEYIEDAKTKHKEDQGDGKDGEHVEHQAGHSGRHADHNHHNVKTNSVLPGVFFIYEIYPFAVEVRPNVVPLTHLLIRLMATVGGVFTIVQFVDGLVEGKRKRPSQSHRQGR